jgi:hypothetical protein
VLQVPVWDSDRDENRPEFLLDLGRYEDPREALAAWRHKVERARAEINEIQKHPPAIAKDPDGRLRGVNCDTRALTQWMKRLLRYNGKVAKLLYYLPSLAEEEKTPKGTATRPRGARGKSSPARKRPRRSAER